MAFVGYRRSGRDRPVAGRAAPDRPHGRGLCPHPRSGAALCVGWNGSAGRHTPPRIAECDPSGGPPGGPRPSLGRRLCPHRGRRPPFARARTGPQDAVVLDASLRVIRPAHRRAVPGRPPRAEALAPFAAGGCPLRVPDKTRSGHGMGDDLSGTDCCKRPLGGIPTRKEPVYGTARPSGPAVSRGTRKGLDRGCLLGHARGRSRKRIRARRASWAHTGQGPWPGAGSTAAG